MRPATFYRLLVLLWMSSATWLGFHLFKGGTHVQVCPVKWMSGIPCPGCGSTRAMLAAFEGDWMGVWAANPLGLIMMPIFLLLPLWFLWDGWHRTMTLHHFWLRMDRLLQRPLFFALVIGTIAINWGWNILKDL